MLITPASVTRITNLQTRTPYKLQSGASVTPNPPSSFTFTLGADSWLPNAALVSIVGVKGKYTGGMASLAIPLPLTTGNMRMTTRFAMNANSLTSLQALEFGTKITDANGITYNGQIQFDYSQSATDMILDVVNSSYKWSPAAPGMPKFAANVEHVVVIDYQFSTTAKTISVADVSVDGQVFSVPANLANLKGQSLGWALNEIVIGFQPDANTTGGGYEWMVMQCDVESW